MTTKARIEEYRKKLQEYHDRVDAWNLRFEKDVSKAKMTTLRVEVAKLRNELQKDLDDLQLAFSKELDKLLTPEQLKGDYDKYQKRLVAAAQVQGYGPDNQAVAELVQAVRDAKQFEGQKWEALTRNPEQFFSDMQRDPELSKKLYGVAKKNVAPPLS